MARTWIFQVNPDKNPGIIAAQRVNRARMGWLVKQFEEELRDATGDVVYVWRSGASRGIVARAHIAGPLSDGKPPAAGPAESTPQRKSVQLEVERWLTDAEMISGAEIEGETALQELSIIKKGQGTNFSVSEGEAAALERMWAGRGTA